MIFLRHGTELKNGKKTEIECQKCFIGPMIMKKYRNKWKVRCLWCGKTEDIRVESENQIKLFKEE